MTTTTIAITQERHHIVQRIVRAVKNRLEQIIDFLETYQFKTLDNSAASGWENRYWQIRSLRQGYPNVQTRRYL